MAARRCCLSLLPQARPSLYFLSRRSLHSATNLSLLLKNYMIPTIRVDKDIHAVAKSLEKKVGLAPLFYQNAPVVLDFEGTEGALGPDQIVTLFEEIHRLSLIPVGITYSNDHVVQNIAKQYRIPFINSNARQTGRPAKPDDSPIPSPSHPVLPPSPAHPPHHSHAQFSQQKPEKVQIRTFMNTIQPSLTTNTTNTDTTHTNNYVSTSNSTISGNNMRLDQNFTGVQYSNQNRNSTTNPPSFNISSPSVTIPSSHAPLPTTPPATTPMNNDVTISNNATTTTNKQEEGPLPLIIKTSLRSGQQIYARNGADLIIMGSVHSGAEALADGNIHIYGSLKGRALAGVSGNLDAKIFSGRFHAELISIADTYCACEEQPPGTDPNKPSVVWLENGNLKFSAIE